MIQQRFRSDYIGEFVVTETVWSGGKKQQKREWIPNPIENHHISGRAAVIIDSCDKHVFDYTHLQRHRGGLLGSKKLQTYGVGSVASEMRLDFAVDTDPAVLKKLLDSNYSKDNIVYTNSRMVISNPGEFYLVPFNPLLHPPALSVYLAAFDCHKEVFILGASKNTPDDVDPFVSEFQKVFSTYSSTKFYIICRPQHHLNQLTELPNVEHMDVRSFVSYCDI